MELLAGAGQTYLVHKGDGRVELVDPLTLARLGSVTVPGGVLSTVDSEGAVWAATGLGTVVRAKGKVADPPLRVAPPGDALAVTMVGPHPVVANLTAGRVRRIEPGSESLDEPVALPGGGGQTLTLNHPANPGPWLWAARRDGTLLKVDLARRTAEAVALERGGSFGAPVVSNGRVYVPDYAHHTVVVVDGAALRRERVLPVSGVGRSFDAFAKDGVVWVNDPTGPTALVIDGSGGVKEVDKGARVVKEEKAAVRQSQPPDTARGSAAPTRAPSPTTGVAGRGAAPMPSAARAGPASASVVTPPAGMAAPPPPAAPTVSVPDVEAKLFDTACAQVRAARLECVPSTTKTAPRGTPRRQVMDQRPDAGTQVGVGSGVTLVFYEPDQVAVPPVKGKPPAEACADVGQAGLNCQQADQGTAPLTVRPGEVTTSSPAEGQLVYPNTTVTVSYYSAAPVPDVRRQRPAQACNEIEAAGFRCQAQDAGKGRPAGVVTDQAPAPGTPKAKNDLVVLRYFSSAPQVPEVTGKDVDAACRDVREAGFVCERRVRRNDTPPGEVYDQRPNAGSEYDLGATVDVFYEEYVTGRIGDWPKPTGVWRNPNADQKLGDVPQGSSVTIQCKRYTGVAGDGWWYKVLAGRSWPAGWIVRADVVRTNGSVPDC